MSTTDLAPPTEALATDDPELDLDEVDEVDEASTTTSTDKPVKTPRPKRPKAPGRTTRVVLRRMDPWSVLKLSIVYYLAVFLVILVAGVLLWGGATSIGAIENIESFMVDIGFDDFKFVGGKLLSGMALGGLVLVVAGTVANVILCALFNLMGDMTGGLKLTLQEDTRRPTRKEHRQSTRTSTVPGLDDEPSPVEPTV
jgi:hypothetical protein